MYKKLARNMIIISSILLSQVSICIGMEIPPGVENIQIYSWTKTKEVWEIEVEKKLNSEEGFNNNIELNNDYVEEIKDLIVPSNDINKENIIRPLYDIENTESNITSGKILRTKRMTKDKNLKRNNHSFSTDSIKSWLKSDNLVNWIEDENNTYTYEWKSNYNPEYTSATEWRLFSGEFVLSDEQLNLFKNNTNKQTALLMGLTTENGPELILPFTGMMSIFVNGKLTNINYVTSTKSISEELYLNIDGNATTYKKLEPLLYKDYCNETYYNELSNHTENKHLHLSKPMVKGSNVLEGDLTASIKSSMWSKTNTIDILIGQTYNNESKNYNGGISKIDLFLVENPKVKVNIIPYIKNSEGESIYLNESYKFYLGEKIYYKFEILNNSEKTSILANKIDSNVGSYKINELEDIKVYTNDSKEASNNPLEELNIKPEEKISIESDSLFHIVDEKDLKTKYFTANSDISFNYINNQTFYTVNRSCKNTVTEKNENKGILKLKISSKDNSQSKDESFYIQVKSNNEIYNLPINLGEEYILEDLDLDKEYVVKLIHPMNYKVINTNSYNNDIENNITLTLDGKEKLLEIQVSKVNINKFNYTERKKSNIKFE